MIEKNLLKNTKKKNNDFIVSLNSKVCFFTGYRPQKCPWGFNEKDVRCLAMKEKIKHEIERVIKRGYDTFLCGMALGFDIICAEIVLELKKQYSHIKLVGALPCKNQSCKWHEKDKIRYNKVLSQLDGVRCIYNYYVDGCMQERNNFMVNSSSLGIALFDGKSGGTKKTIEYAEKQNVEIIIIKPLVGSSLATFGRGGRGDA